jgi:hypothetical protein
MSAPLENRVRRKAGRIGWRVCKSRQQQHCDNHGEFQLVDDNNTVVLGDRYDASLDEIESYLDERMVDAS